jgi:hypothetical protein
MECTMTEPPATAIDATTTQRAFTFEGWVPDPLPEGATDETVADICKGQLVAKALAEGFQIDPETYESTTGGPERGPAGAGRVVHWSAVGIRVETPGEIAVEAQEVEEGAWVADLPEPHNGGFYSVRHKLDTEDVVVQCYRADGSPIGYLETMPIDVDDITVIAVAHTAAIRLSAAPGEPQDAEQGQPDA